MNDENWIEAEGVKCYGITHNANTRLICSIDEFDIITNELNNLNAQEILELEDFE